MDLVVSYNLESEEQFWEELVDILSAPASSHEEIDNVLRSYLSFITSFADSYASTPYSVALCAHRLLSSAVFTANADYVRRQFVYGLLQEDDNVLLYLIGTILLYDGKRASSESLFEMMQSEGAFPRLVELIQTVEQHGTGDFHRCLLDLLYEMARVQRLAHEDLASINDNFVLYLFNIIESLSSDASDPYHYPVIRVLLVLNEQYMVFSTLHPPGSSSPTQPPVTNRVLKILSSHSAEYKTFGENIILLLNRESETSLQLIILKLLYLVFSAKATAEYFYTNDLHVLLDVILRNLLDLPSDDDYAPPASATETRTNPMQALRHTYLRVLHPLLGNSQLRRPGMGYKREEICAVLSVLAGGTGAGSVHFAPTDTTTTRLVERCRSVEWLQCHNATKSDDDESPLEGSGHAEVARRSLGMSVNQAGESALSVLAVASHTVQPGIITPSRGLQGQG